jgi:hypothetical protein
MLMCAAISCSSDLDSRQGVTGILEHTLRTTVGRPQLPVRSMHMNSEIDYRAIVDPLRATGQGSEVLAGALSDAWSAAYRADTPAANLYAFGPEPWTFLFDSQVRPGHRNGTERLLRGDFPLQANAPATSYQRRYPSPNGRAERAGRTAPRQRHMVPHQLGGMHGQNIFPKDRKLNRGWSAGLAVSRVGTGSWPRTRESLLPQSRSTSTKPTSQDGLNSVFCETRAFMWNDSGTVSTERRPTISAPARDRTR